MSARRRLEIIRSKFENTTGRETPSSDDNLPKAAVCLILRPSGDEIFILLIRRRDYPSDPWSGHVALPGGKFIAKTDSDLLATVRREVREEIGAELASVQGDLRLIGSLDVVVSGSVPLMVTPFVAIASENLVEFSVNESEVQEYFWVPLSFFEDQNNLTPYSVTRGSVTLNVCAYAYMGKGKIWGMTLRIIQNFIAKIS